MISERHYWNSEMHAWVQRQRKENFIGCYSNKSKGEGENEDKDRTDPGQPTPHHFTKSSVNILNTNSRVLKNRSDFFFIKEDHNSFNHSFVYEFSAFSKYMIQSYMVAKVSRKISAQCSNHSLCELGQIKNSSHDI